MKRRQFLVATAASTGVPAQLRAQPSSLPRIAYVSGRSLGSDGLLLQAFREGLATTGSVDGQNVVVEAWWADGAFARVPKLLEEAMARKPRVIAAVGGSPVAIAAKAATSTIPVVFSAGADPVALGLVRNPARPDGNLTGVTLWAPALDAKRLDLLRQMVPRARKVALLTNPGNPGAVEEQRAMAAASGPLGIQLLTLEVTSSGDLERAFEKLPAGEVDALAVVGDAFLISRRDRIVALASLRRLPAIYPAREFADNGGLASYGTRWADMYRIAGSQAGRLLKGDKPADLPVQRPTTYELVINLHTAKALGLTLPPALLSRANQLLD
jgi:putative ABC transport system substrate-binding protein